MPTGGACPMCGWPGRKRNGDGRCIDYAACAHRMVLVLQGRPRDSGCGCLTWPCWCVCHEGLRPTDEEHEPTFDQVEPS